MDKVELMKIEETYKIEGRGLILAPSFELPPSGKWENITEQVLIQTPRGEEIIADAMFSVAHLNVKDPNVSISKRWPLIVSLNGISKENVPVGSLVFVSIETKYAVAGKKA